MFCEMEYHLVIGRTRFVGKKAVEKGENVLMRESQCVVALRRKETLHHTFSSTCAKLPPKTRKARETMKVVKRQPCCDDQRSAITSVAQPTPFVSRHEKLTHST